MPCKILLGEKKGHFIQLPFKNTESWPNVHFMNFFNAVHKLYLDYMS